MGVLQFAREWRGTLDRSFGIQESVDGNFCYWCWIWLGEAPFVRALPAYCLIGRSALDSETCAFSSFVVPIFGRNGHTNKPYSATARTQSHWCMYEAVFGSISL